MKWGAGALAALAALLAVLLVLADTGAGHRTLQRFLADFIAENGLEVRVGEIQGSIYGRMTLHDLELRDPEGAFLTSPRVTVDWRPWAFVLRNRLVLHEVASPELRVLRPPELKPTPEREKDLLPSFDISLGKLALDRLVLEAPVAGRRQEATISGAIELREGRLLTELLAKARPSDGVGGGDLVSVRLDAMPEADRLLIDARVEAPAGGAIAGLTGLERPLNARVSGEGTWTSWTGRAVARIGDEQLAQLGLAARSGSFAVRGQLRPAIILSGGAAALLEPRVAVDLAATLRSGRRLATRLNLASDAAAVAAEGLLDLRRSRFGDLRLQAQLLQPSVLSPDLQGRDVRLSLRLAGPFSTPNVQYDLVAGQLGLGDARLENIAANGRFQVRPERTVVPVHATVERITGLNESVAGLTRNVRIDGDVVVTPEQIATDNLRLRSNGLDATLVASASLGAGQYVAALKGSVNRFEQPGVGVFDFVTDARLSTSPDGAMSIRGNLSARSRRIDNDSLRDLLGGQMTAQLAFERAGSGAVVISDLDVTAPQLRIENGRGRIGADGTISASAVGQSERYGRVELTAAGSVQDPVIRLKADDPRLGLPLTDLVVELRRSPSGYVISATGSSPYGPLSAEAALGLGDGPLSLEIREAVLAGIRLTGALRQTSAGPFAGVLRLSGSGLNGTLRLSAAGDVQRADAQVQARNARLPLAKPVLIAAGAVQGTAILYPERPAVTAQARLSGVRQGQLVLEQATAKLAYENRRGTLDLATSGSGGTAFSVGVRAALGPDVVVVNAKGSVAGNDLRLDAPARLRRTANGWRLAPTTMLLDQGRVELAGEFGDASSLRARLRSVDLGLSRAIAPELGLGGQASGVIDLRLPPNDMPVMRADLTVDNLIRSGLVSSGVPVDVKIVADLASTGGQANAVIRRGGDVIGRVKAQLGAIPAGPAAWTQRLARASLSGGLRYNGPASVPWSLTGVTGQTLSGPLALGVDFSGRVGNPQLSGVLRAQALRYENQDFGTVIRDMALEGRLAGSRVELTRLSGRAGSGTVSGSGYINLSADQGFPMDLRLNLVRAELADSDTLGAVLTGDIAITNGPQSGALISGRTVVQEARYQIARRGAAEVPELTGVRRAGAAPTTPDASADGGGLPGVWRLDIAVEGDNRIFVSGMGLQSEWRTSLRIRGTAAQPRIVGEARVVRGDFNFAGRRFELSRGVIRFDGGSAIDPAIDLVATTAVEGVSASINVGGAASNPQITFNSTPALPQDEIIARLLFGSSAAELSAGQALQLAASLNALRGGGGGNPLMSLRQATGVDRLRFLGADESGGQGPALAAGKYISNDVYLEVTTGANGFTAIQIEIALTKTLSILSQAGSFGNTNLNLRYRRDY